MSWKIKSMGKVRNSTECIYLRKNGYCTNWNNRSAVTKRGRMKKEGLCSEDNCPIKM